MKFLLLCAALFGISLTQTAFSTAVNNVITSQSPSSSQINGGPSASTIAKLQNELYLNIANNLSSSTLKTNSNTNSKCFGNKNNDLITNGDFENSPCATIYCHSTDSSPAPGWEDGNGIELGKGYIYNNVMGDSWVTALDDNANTCFKQKLNLYIGSHTLYFDWAARNSAEFESNSFNIKINGQILKQIKSSDYNVHHDNISFNLASNSITQISGDVTIQFCGTEVNNSQGIVLDNIKLLYNDGC